MEAVYQILDELFEDYFIYRLQHAEKFGLQSIKYMKESEYVFLGGTNSLSSEMNKYKQIGFSLKDIFFVNNLVLLGVGWWQYQKKPNLYTTLLLKKLLSRNVIHSVRDSYTVQMLKNIGIHNVINTSCPSLWSITEEHCSKIPTIKSQDVITTLTDYNKDPFSDEKLVNMLLKYYDTVYFFIQGVGDLDYLNSLNIKDKSRIKIIPPKLKSLDKILENNEVDYIGTRLHAGIRAIQKLKRSLIIVIDNRALEISKDVGLNIAKRGDFKSIQSFIENEYRTKIKIPFENIIRWKSQFKRN
jgi:hypothetical protein